jgi:hypothetical protein
LFVNDADFAPMDGLRFVPLVGLDETDDVVHFERVQLSLELGGFPVPWRSQGREKWTGRVGDAPSPRVVVGSLLFEVLEDLPSVGRAVGVAEVHSVLGGLKCLIRKTRAHRARGEGRRSKRR